MDDDILKEAEFLNRYDPRQPDEQAYFVQKAKPILDLLYKTVIAQQREIDMLISSKRSMSLKMEQLELACTSHDKTVKTLNARIVEEIDKFNRLQNIVGVFKYHAGRFSDDLVAFNKAEARGQ